MKKLKNVAVFKNTILSILDEEKVRRRTPFEKPIKLNYVFPTTGKKFQLYRLLRLHILDVARFINVLTEYELYTIERAIEAKIVPDIFLAPIKNMLDAKKNGFVVEEIVFGNGEKFPLFQYEDETILDSYHTSPELSRPTNKFAQLPDSLREQLKTLNIQDLVQLEALYKQQIKINTDEASDVKE